MRPRLGDAPSGIVGEGHTRLRTPSPTRNASPSDPPSGLRVRAPSPVTDRPRLGDAPSGIVGQGHVQMRGTDDAATGRIPALAVRVMLALGYLNGVDCMYLLHVNCELRAMGQSVAFWKAFVPFSLVERAKGDISLLRRDFLVVTLPLALAERVAEAAIVVRATGAPPQAQADLSGALQRLMQKQQPCDPYFVKALVLASYLRYGELVADEPVDDIVVELDWIKSLLPADVHAAIDMLSTPRAVADTAEHRFQSAAHALASYRRCVSIHLQAPTQGIRDMGSLHACFFNNVCSSSIHWQQMVFHKPRHRLAQHGHLLSAMMHSDSMQDPKLSDLVARYVSSSCNHDVTALLFGDAMPLRVLSSTGPIQTCFEKLESRTEPGQWTPSDVLWMLENFAAFSEHARDVWAVLRTVDPRMLLMQALRCRRVFEAVVLKVLPVPISLDFSERDGNGPMPIGVACVEDLRLIAALRGAGKVAVNWQFTNNAGQTALFFQSGEEVSFLVREGGLSVNHVSRAGATPVYAWMCRHVEGVLNRSSREHSIVEYRGTIARHADWAPGGHSLLMRLVAHFATSWSDTQLSDLIGILYTCGAPITADLTATMLRVHVANWSRTYWPALRMPAPANSQLPPVERLSVLDPRFAAAFVDVAISWSWDSNTLMKQLERIKVEGLESSPLIDMAGLTWADVEAQIRSAHNNK